MSYLPITLLYSITMSTSYVRDNKGHLKENHRLQNSPWSATCEVVFEPEMILNPNAWHLDIRSSYGKDNIQNLSNAYTSEHAKNVVVPWVRKPNFRRKLAKQGKLREQFENMSWLQKREQTYFEKRSEAQRNLVYQKSRLNLPLKPYDVQKVEPQKVSRFRKYCEKYKQDCKEQGISLKGKLKPDERRTTEASEIVERKKYDFNVTFPPTYFGLPKIQNQIIGSP